MTDPPISARVDELRHALEAGQVDALEAFWSDVERLGTPLIEEAGSPEERLVTFLWREANGATRNVRIMGCPVAGIIGVSPPLHRLFDTNIFYRTFRVRSDLRGTYRLIVNGGNVPDFASAAAREEVIRFYRAARPDPLNPRSQVIPLVVAWLINSPIARDSSLSVLELPDAPPQPWFDQREGVATGAVEQLTLTSAALGKTRRVWIYTPAERGSRAAPHDLLVLTDGEVWASAYPLASTFDNLIAEGRIPPLTVAMVESVDAATRNHDLTGSKRFLTFLTDELVPFLRSRSCVTDNPQRTVIAGQSFGGLTALFGGLQRPDVFGSVLSQAGAFQRLPGSPEWLIQAYADAPKLPLRIYLDVGILDEETIVDCNRRLRDVLMSKGYDLDYTEFTGAHDYWCWRGTIADGLVALLGS